jgi:hypothetical protein
MVTKVHKVTSDFLSRCGDCSCFFLLVRSNTGDYVLLLYISIKGQLNITNIPPTPNGPNLKPQATNSDTLREKRPVKRLLTKTKSSL